MEELKLNDMDGAPRDGSSIVIFWETPNADFETFQVREGYWEDFKYLPEDRRKKLSPCWKYISDKNSVMEIKNPIGWIPCPNNHSCKRVSR